MSRKVNLIVIHCTAGPQAQTTKSIKDYWRSVLKWRSVGYHFIINADGSYEQLAPLESVVNGVAGHNSNSVHICYKGGWNGKDTRTVEQRETMLKLVREMRQLYPLAKIVGHRDLSPDKNGDGKITPNEWVKLCPCFPANLEYKSI